MLCIATQAHAAAITNLADIPYDLKIIVGDDEQMVAIDPGHTWRTDTYPTYVYVKNRRVLLEDKATYAIWKDGTFTKQTHGNITHKD